MRALSWAARLRHTAAVFGRYRGGANTVIGRALPAGCLGAKRPDSLHVFAEAGRLAFADRNRYLADPDFVAIPRGMLDAAYLKLRGSQIDLSRSMKRAEAGTPPGSKVALAPDATIEASGTSHISVVDRYGNAVAMTTTIEDQFGARVMVRAFCSTTVDRFFVRAARGGNPSPIASKRASGRARRLRRPSSMTATTNH